MIKCESLPSANTKWHGHMKYLPCQQHRAYEHHLEKNVAVEELQHWRQLLYVIHQRCFKYT